MCMPLDSPGVPPSANAHQLFKGFSFVATTTVEDHKISPLTNILPIVQVTFYFLGNLFNMPKTDQYLVFTVCSFFVGETIKMSIIKMLPGDILKFEKASCCFSGGRIQKRKHGQAEETFAVGNSIMAKNILLL